MQSHLVRRGTPQLTMQSLACGHSAEKNKSGNIGAGVTGALGPKGMQPGQCFGITGKVKNTPIRQLW